MSRKSDFQAHCKVIEEVASALLVKPEINVLTIDPADHWLIETELVPRPVYETP
jgi:hypothetical protein